MKINILTHMIQLILVLTIILSCEFDERDLEPDLGAAVLKATTDIYVSTKGSDSNPGTLEKPFASWQKAFTVVQPGYTVYIRGGVYYPDRSRRNGVYIKGKSGTSTRPIRVFAYPGEVPVLDCSGLASGNNSYGVYLVGDQLLAS